MDSSDDNDSAPPRAQAQFDVGSTDDSLQRMQENFAELGDVYCVHAPGRQRDTWVVSDPETLKRVLVSNHRSYTIGVGLDRVKILVGNGIIVSEGERWQRQHRMIQPIFQRSQMSRFGELIAVVNRRRLADWAAKERSGAALNITKETSECALEVVLRATLGDDVDRLTAQSGGNPFSILTEEAERDLRFAFRFRQLGKHIEDSIARRETQGANDSDDWLAMLMTARDRRDGTGMSHRELIDEVMSLIVAGHETTAATLNSVWYLLSRHPDVEAKLHAEVDAVELPDLRLETVESLQYTHQVICEALRLYPPVWVLSRRCVHADRLSGYDLPEGTDVFMSPYLVHRHPRYWADPEKFMPERFAADTKSTAHRFAYLPFSAGPRHCVGETFATYEMAIHVYLAAKRFKLRLQSQEPMEMEARINLRTRKDLLMTVERRA